MADAPIAPADQQAVTPIASQQLGTGAPNVGSTVPDPSAPAAPASNPNAINPAQPPAPPKGGTPVGIPNPVPHQRLLSMVAGLAEGLSAAGTSIATRGKEGGAKEVAAYQQQQQEMAQSQKEAAQTITNQQTENALKQADTNRINLMIKTNTATLPAEISKANTEAVEAKQRVQSGAIGIDTAIANFQRENYGLTPPSQLPGGGASTPGVPAPAITPDERKRVDAALNSSINLGTGVLGPDKNSDPTLAAAVEQAKGVLGNPKATRDDVTTAQRFLTNSLQNNKMVLDSRKAQQAAAESAPIGAKATVVNQMLQDRYHISHPNAPLPVEYQVTPNSTPKDYDRINASLDATDAAVRTKAMQDQTMAIHQQTLDLLRGPQGIDPNLSGPDYIAAVAKTDPGEADLLKGYGQGRLVLSPTIARTPQGISLTKQILRAYPNYVAAKAEGYQKLYNDFTSGKIGTSLNSYKTSLDHLNAMFDNVASASAADLNNPLSTVHRQLDVDKNYLSTELAKAVSNGNMTEGEKDSFLASVDGKTLGVQTRGTYQDKLRENVRLLAGKLDGFQSQWKAGAVEGVEPPSNLIDAANATQKLASGGAGTQAAAPRTPPAGVPVGSKLMQVPGGQPHWMSPDKIAAAQKLGATEVQ